MSAEKYQNVVIGSRDGGKYLARHLAQSGQTTVVERFLTRHCATPFSRIQP